MEKPLYDPVHALTGKPDYLVEKGSRLIPVEVKTGQVGGVPYQGHVLQLAAYCLLVERVYGKRPPYGILHYPERTFAIDFTRELESALLDVLAEMRADEARTQVDRSHEFVNRCRKCGYLTVCDQSI